MKRKRTQSRKSKGISKPKVNPRGKTHKTKKKEKEEFEIIELIDPTSKQEEKFLPLDEDYMEKISQKNTELNKKRKRPKSEQKLSRAKRDELKQNKKLKVDYKKGKYNTRIDIIKKDESLEGNSNEVDNSCCVICSNRNCVRAAQTKNYNLMEKCINDTEHISSIIEPYSITIGTAVEKAIENNDKKMLEIIFKSLDNNKVLRCQKEQPKIQLTNTGENSVYMVGIRTRKLNQTRGNKMGNDAFIRDDTQTDMDTLANSICQIIMEKTDDPSWIDYMKSLKLGQNNNQTTGSYNNRYYNYSNNLNLTFESYIISAVLKGNIQNAKHLLNGLEQNYNYGFNILHYQVLSEKKADNIQIKVKTSLTKKPPTNFGMTPMHIVCINPDPSFIKKLVSLGGDWNVLDDLNRKPIHYAACCKNDKPLNYLLSLGALIDEVDKEKKSPLMYACMAGRLDCVKLLIKKKANILLKDKFGKNTAFHFACKNGYLNIVKYFVENTDIKIDLPGEERMTGLMLASFYGHYDLVKYLLENKAKLTKKDKFKRTPLLHSIRGGHIKIVSYLLSKGADYEQPDSSNNTPLHYACASGFKNIVELLLKAGASPNPSNDWKYTPLEIGFVKNHFGIIKYLLNYVDVNTRFNLDMCLIHYSFKKITKKVVEEEIRYLILEKKCDINVQDYYGDSCLHYLAKYDINQFNNDNSYYYNQFYSTLNSKKRKEKIREIYQDLIKRVFEILIQCDNLNINLINKEGKTPFQLALEKKNYFFIDEILKLNPQLCFIDKKDNSVFHSLVPFIYEFKIPQDKKLYIIDQILDRLKNSLSEDELNRISNSYDENGFTPLLKLMYEYYKNIHTIFNNIKNEITEEYKEEQKGISGNDLNNNNEFNNFAFNPFSFGQKNQNNVNNLTKDDLDIVHKKSIVKFNSFIDNILSVIKKFISLKSNPEIKVGKLSLYRNSNNNTNGDNDNKIPIISNINMKNDNMTNKKTNKESQYFQGQGKNSILLYLMSYPKKEILEYFIETIKVPINIYNLYKRNSLYFLIDSIAQIYEIDKNYSLIKDSFNYLINKGIEIECIDYLGNNPFLYLSKNKFEIDLLEIFHKNKCNINKFNKADENSLFYYIRKKDYDKVKILIEQFKVDYTLCDNKKRSIIHYLCNDEISSTDMDERLCDYLLSLKIHLNSEDILGRTPIHYLFVKINDEYNSTDIDPINTLTKLLEYDEVDPEHKDIYGNTPLHYACQRGSIISTISLGAKGINYDIKNKENNSPLAYSILFKKENVAISLIQQNVDLDQYAYPLEDRNEKKKIEEINKNKNDKMDLSDDDLDSSKEIEITNEILQKENKDVKVESNNKKETIEDINKNKMEIENNKNSNNNNIDNDSDDDVSSESSQNKNTNQNNIFNFNNNNNIYNPFTNFNNTTFGNNNTFRKGIKRIGILGRNNLGYKNNFNSNYNYNYNYNNKFNNSQILSNAECPSFISTMFGKKNKGIKLFRVCIKNNFQGLTHLFISKGYGLMKAIEDSFYESKFNLAMKLLIRSPYNKTYQVLNNEKQNLFHILGHIKKNNIIEKLNEILDVLYKKEIPLDAKDIYGNTPLHYAAKNLFKEFIEFILNKYKDKQYLLNIENNENHTPFYLATKDNNINLINKDIFDLLFTTKNINQINLLDESLIDKNKNVVKKKHFKEDNYKCSLLLYIIRLMLNNQTNDNYKYFYQKLIQNGASLMERDSYGKSALIYTVIENNFPFLKMLCDSDNKNKDLYKNIIDVTNKKSLVHYCVSLNNFGSYENKEMLIYLLDNNFIFSTKDMTNKTPLEYALEQKSLNNLIILKNKKVTGTENINLDEIKKNYKNIIEEQNKQKANQIPIVDFEQDSKEYFNKIINSIPESEYKKKPNLREYQTEFFELYKENKEYWDVSLTKVNIQNGIYGEYMFYFIQLIHDLGKNMYIVTTQFGRIGEVGANQRSPFNTLDEAKNEFNKIFKSKTGNSWEERNNFKRVKGKYMLLSYNKYNLKPNELLKPFDYDKCPKSNILNNEIQNLLKNITDNSIIEKAFKESGINTDFFNYSMLNKDILLKAKNYLIDIYNKVQELDKLRNLNVNLTMINKEDNKDNNNDMEIEEEDKKDKIKDIKDIKTLKDKTDAIMFKTNEIMDLSNRYYELIPKERYKNSCILPLDRLDDVKNEIQIIDNLTYIENAVKILLGANNKLNAINPLDYIYYSLQTYFNLLEKESPEYLTIQKYINNTSGNDKIKNIFSVTRKEEVNKSNNKFEELSNHFLLFHGTKIFNLIGIFSNGLKIAPPEAPTTGYMFGKGIYFSDMYQKSIDYCDTIQDKSNPNKIKNYSYILLCEAAFGNIYEPKIRNPDFESLPFLNEGYDSLKSKSISGPDPNKNFVCNNGTIIPLGNIITYNNFNNNNNNFLRQNNMPITSYPEYVIYNTEQIKIRYIAQMEKDGNFY